MKAEARIPLSRDRVLRTAVELADASGVEALTMRRLGDELGFEAMSLYRHVASKSDLLDGMLDFVLEEWELPDGRADWRKAIRASASSVHDALRRHPWAAQLLMTGILGEYVGRIYEELKRRPLYITSEELNFNSPVESPVSSPGPTQNYRGGPPRA